METVTTHQTPKAYKLNKSFEAPKEIIETKLIEWKRETTPHTQEPREHAL